MEEGIHKLIGLGTSTVNTGLRYVVDTRGSHKDGELCGSFPGRATGAKGSAKNVKKTERDRERQSDFFVGYERERGSRQST